MSCQSWVPGLRQCTRTRPFARVMATRGCPPDCNFAIDWRPLALVPALALLERYRYNPGLESRYMLVPGAIAIVMAMIGCLLTALVNAHMPVGKPPLLEAARTAASVSG